MSDLRDQIREKALATKLLKSKVIDFFGTKIEVRQLRMTDVLDKNETVEEVGETLDGVKAPKASFLVDQMIKICYVPGTDELVFEEGDKEALRALPFGADVTRLTEAMKELSEVNFQPMSDSSRGDQTTT